MIIEMFNMTEQANMEGLRLFQGAVKIIGPILILVCILILRSDYKNSSNSNVQGWWRRQCLALRSIDSIWVILVIEVMLFISGGVAIAMARGKEDIADYIGFAAPCVASIIVGLGILVKVGKQAKFNHGPKEFSDPEVNYYLTSILILLMAFVGYMVANYSDLVFSITVTAFVGICMVAYCFLFGRHEWVEGPSRQPGKILGVGAGLGALFLVTLCFTCENYHYLKLQEPHCSKCCNQGNAADHQEQPTSKPSTSLNRQT